MAFNIVRGSKETVNVTVVDNTGALTSLAGLTPQYSVVPIDPATNLEKSISHKMYSDESAVSSGMMIQALVDTRSVKTYNNAKATNAPALPLTVVAGTNDQFRYNSTAFIVPPGTYSDINALAAAVQASKTGGVTSLAQSPYAVNVDVSDDVPGKLIFVTDTTILAPGVANGYLINTGTTHDVLISLGFTNGQAMATYASTDAVLWNKGAYNLYASFVSGSNRPILGPVGFYII